MPVINNFRPGANVFVRILAPCHIAGLPVKVDDVVEVSRDDAGLICAAQRGKIVPAPEKKDEKKPADKK